MSGPRTAERGGVGPPALLSRVRRVGPGVVDAGVASARNLVLGLAAAQAVDLTSFGQYGTAVLVALVATGASKALHADPLVLAHPTRPGGEVGGGPDTGGATFGPASRRASGAVLAAGTLLAAVLAAGALAASSLLGSEVVGLLVGLAVVLPGVLLLDQLRWVAHARDRGWVSVGAGVVWAAVSSAATGALWVWGEPTAVTLVLAWGCGAVPAAGVALLRLRTAPTLHRWWRWYPDHRTWCARLGVDWALLQLTAEGAVVLVAVLTTAEQIGELRKAQLPLAPVIVLTTGLVIFLQPALTRAVAAGASDADVARRSHLAALVIGAVAAGYGSLVLLVPTPWMDALVGGDWERAGDYVWPLALGLVAGGAAAPLGIALRVTGRLGRQVRARLWLAVPVLAGTALTATLGGALAAAWWIAVATVVVTAVFGVLTVLPGGSRRPSAQEVTVP